MLKKLGVFNLLCVIGDILLLMFRSLVTDVYILILLYGGINVKICICYTRSGR